MKKSLLRITLLVVLAFFSILMVRLSLPYTSMHSDVSFLRTKQRIYHIRYWRISFYTHVFTSCLVLLAGFTQFAPRLLVRRPQIHRLMGWVYLVVVTTISGPAAFIMALYANGGLPARTSFTLLATCWITFTLCAGYYAFRRRFALHGAFMFRSYALTLSAIMLRCYTYLIDLTTLPISPRDVYILTAWFSWVPNLILAEVLIRRGWVERIYRMPQRPIAGPGEQPSVGISH